jgi:hypothetical protein
MFPKDYEEALRSAQAMPGALELQSDKLYGIQNVRTGKGKIFQARKSK